MSSEQIKDAVYYFKSGNLQAAESILKKILLDEPHNVDAWFGLALCVTDAKKQKYCLEKVLSLNPDHQKARELLFSNNQTSVTESNLQSSAIVELPHRELQKTEKPTILIRSQRKRRNILRIGIIAGLVGLIIILCPIMAFLLFSSSEYQIVLFASPSPSATVAPTKTKIPPTPTKGDCDCVAVRAYLGETAKRLEGLGQDMDYVVSMTRNNRFFSISFSELSGRAKARYEHQHEEYPPLCMESLDRRVIGLFYSWWQSMDAVTNDQYDFATFNLEATVQRMGEIEIEIEHMIDDLERCKPGEEYYQG